MYISIIQALDLNDSLYLALQGDMNEVEIYAHSLLPGSFSEAGDFEEEEDFRFRAALALKWIVERFCEKWNVSATIDGLGLMEWLAENGKHFSHLARVQIVK